MVEDGVWYCFCWRHRLMVTSGAVVVSTDVGSVGVEVSLSGAAVSDNTSARHILLILPLEKGCAPTLTLARLDVGACSVYRSWNHTIILGSQESDEDCIFFRMAVSRNASTRRILMVLPLRERRCSNEEALFRQLM